MSLVLVYNASGSILGEIAYISKKISCSIKKQESPCPACDITHSVKELGMKKEFKQVLQRFPNLKTLHTNELDSNMSKFLNNIDLPVLLQVEQENIKVIANRQALLDCKGSVQAFEKILDEIKH